MKQGLLINFEGMDGAGKGDQLQLMFAKLMQLGIPTMQTREPGGFGVSEEIRLLIKDNREPKLLPMTELLLFYAARNENFHRNVKPHLDNDFIVLTDRHTPSTIAYQGGGRGMEMGVLDAIDQIVLDSFQPDLTIILDVDLATSTARKGNREYSDSFDEESPDFHERVRQSYLNQAAGNPERFCVIDARGTVDDVHEKVAKVVLSLINK